MESNRGLAGSIWAPQNRSNPYKSTFYSNGRSQGFEGVTSAPLGQGSKTDFDWDCTFCGFSNFAWRKECFRCQKAKEEISRNASPAKFTYGDENSGPVQGTAIGKGDDVPQVVKSNGLLGHNATVDIMAERPGVTAPRGALAMSRWAPRNREASQKYGDKPWTRVMPNPALSSTTNDVAIPSLDLGLPYEVQHYILSLLQRILEEGSFAIASRWLPAQLAAKGWSCSEAVELAAWRDFLPNNLPHQALHRVNGGGISLEQGLIDAVKIRNKAVHRHLVDNNELRGLCWKGERLMTMFGDTLRQEKCRRLQEELALWDEFAKKDRDEARRRLELALVEIGERPVGEMDWAPNELSLAEIHTDAAGTSGDSDSKGDESVDDVMDLD